MTLQELKEQCLSSHYKDRTEVIILHLIERNERLSEALEIWLSSTPTRADSTYDPINNWHACKALEVLSKYGSEVPLK